MCVRQHDGLLCSVLYFTSNCTADKEEIPHARGDNNAGKDA